MVKKRSGLRIGPRLPLIFALVAARGLLAAQSPAPPVMEVEEPPPVIVAVAIDEVGISQGDLRRGQDLVLALLPSLPAGSKITVASFSGDRRIILPSTSDESLVAPALAGFKAGRSGVALPDGLFDVVQYLGSSEAASRALILVSTGRVREGDLHFEDPLNAATSKGIRIFCLAAGPGDGKLLRRIAKLTSGEYIRLEVADVSMLTRALVPISDPASMATRDVGPDPLPLNPETKVSTGLLGAAALFFTLGGLLMLGLVVLLVRRLGRPAPALPPVVIQPREPPAPPAESPLDLTLSSQDETFLEKTLTVNANPILRALSGPGAGKNFPLSAGGQTTMGRSPRNDIVVPENGASAQQCRIDREGDSYVLHDLGSTNGSWVNATRVARVVLGHGDRLKVGDTVFTVSLFGDRS